MNPNSHRRFLRPAAGSARIPVLRLPGLIALLLAAGGPATAPAQQTPSAPPPNQTSSTSSNAPANATGPEVRLEEMTVLGVRGSLINAQEIKQNSLQIVDSIVAQDIGKLPDNTVADALQRVPGIQVSRDNGEVNSVVIRGLPNLGTTVNGHEIYTGTARGVALQDLPADLVAGVDVYKTNAPDQIEGGIAGLIDIRFRRPFDFKEGWQLFGSARGIHGENAEHDSLVGSALVSNRWKTSGGGEFGAMIAASYQNYYFSDQRVFNFLWEPVNTTAVPGQTQVILPQTAGSLLTPGHRRRPALEASLQWRPNDELELYSDFLWTGYRNKHEVYFFIGFPRDGALFNTAQTIELAPGTNVVHRIVTSPGNFQLTSTQAFDDRTDGYQAVFGGKWKRDRLEIDSEIVYNWNRIKNRGVIVDTQFAPPGPATFTFDLHSDHGTNVSVTGADISDGDNFRFWGLFDNRQYAGSGETAWKADAIYSLGSGGFLTRLKGGVRVSDRDVRSRASSRNDIPPAAGRGVQPTNTVPGFGRPAPDGLFSSDEFGASHWFGGNPDFQRDNPDVIRGVFGLPPGEPPYNPTNTFNDSEKTYAAYAQADYHLDFGERSLEGLFGVRVVQTDQDLEGFRSDGTPINGDRSQTEVLPVVNGRMALTDKLYLRFSAGRSVTRPNFGDLNPVVTLNAPTTTGGSIGTGSGGNPDLETVRSDNYDASLEYYFAEASYISLTPFYRTIDGYVQSFAATEVIDGVSYNVVRPRNTGRGHLDGIEASYTQFFDFLPGPFQGFGLQANYTYIEGETEAGNPTGTGTVRRPYAQVAKNSYTIIGIYERGPFSARLAYTRRGEYVDTFDGPNAPPPAPLSELRTITVKPTERWDFSAQYRVRDNLTVSFDVTNVFDSDYQDYFFDPSLYQRDTRKYDRTFELGVRYHY